jgi:hypothetical protein
LATVLFSLVLGVFLSTPRREIILNCGDAPELRAVEEKIRDPFSRMDQFAPTSHESKLTFRILVPTVARISGLGTGGCKLLEVACGIAMLAYAALAFERVTHDRTMAFLLTVASSCIFAGNTAFVEFRGMYDGVAIFLLVLAIHSRSAIVVPMAVFLAAWTDERALLASSLVLLFHATRHGTNTKAIFKSLSTPVPASIFLAWLGYAGLRWHLSVRYGMATATGGIGVGIFKEQINNLPLGIWSALEGLWILVLGAIIVLGLRKQWLCLASLCMTLALPLIASFCVADITRSAAYLFPGVFIVAGILADSERKAFLTRLVATAAVICVLWPSVYAGGKESAWWHSPPLPIQIGRWYFLGK